MSRFDLVIFDCDGVLIDSERLAIRTESQLLTELGWPLSEEEIIELFVGRSSAHMQMVIEEKLGRAIDWHHEFERREREVYERELVPVEGVIAALEEITLPSCVASSSSHEMLRFQTRTHWTRRTVFGSPFQCRRRRAREARSRRVPLRGRVDGVAS